MTANNKTLTQQFQSFYADHKPKTLEDAIEKFSIFGGVDWGNVETDKDSFVLIEKLILSDYRFIRNDVTELTSGAPVYHSVLSGIAQGDGKTHSSYKRANVAEDVGDAAVEALIQRGIIRVEKARNVFTSWQTNEKVDNKLFFTTPFMRFWFAFISPLFKGIRDGDYSEVKKRFQNNENEFVRLTFVQLAHEYLKLSFKDDKIVEIGTYWDRETELDVYAKTQSGKTIVGNCKYANQKVKKSDLTRLQEASKKANIEVDAFVFFSKSGYTNELKSLKGENLKLFGVKSLKTLLE